MITFLPLFIIAIILFSINYIYGYNHIINIMGFAFTGAGFVRLYFDLKKVHR